MLTPRTLPELYQVITSLKRGGRRLALVPTMGALHQGHLSLVADAKKRADAVIVSIFVNPTQFGKGEDFSSYPRQEEQDLDLLQKNGVDAVFLPTPEVMYPHGFATKVCVQHNTDILCGATRTGHFDGVATVVTKLLLQCQPDIALFGEKDYQQLHIIRRTAKDLNIPVTITGVPTLREEDGLALSSRNTYLNEQQRSIAPLLYRTLCSIRDTLLSAPEKSEETILKQGISSLLNGGFDKVDYLELRDAETLHTLSMDALFGGKPARLLVAAHLGKCRLIDNIAVEK